MSNQPITDMIDAIERFAQLQPDYPVYNVLGEEHTYGQLKADSDSLAAHIDQMGLPWSACLLLLKWLSQA